MKKLLNKIVNFLKKILKLLLIPFNLFFSFITNIFKKSEKKMNLEDITFNIYDKYGEKIMFKLEIGTNGENLIIYSSNYKTTLEKAKKRQKDEDEKVEKVEKDSAR